MKLPVWVYLVLGPWLWMGTFSLVVERSLRDALGIAFLYAMGFCVNLGVVSICIPWIERRH